MSEFKPQGLSNTAWAYATVKQLDERLIRALAKAAEQRVNEFDVHGLANTAWALVTVNELDWKLFNALERWASESNEQALSEPSG